MASRAKNKLQLIDAISQYHKQQQGQIGQTNNTRTKSAKPPKHLEKVKTMADELDIKLEEAVIMKKSKCKRTVKDKVQNQIRERVEKEMENKTKLITVREDRTADRIE